MNPKEMVYAQIAHKETPYIPYTIRFDKNSGLVEKLDAHYGSSSWQDSLNQHIVRVYPIDTGMRWQTDEQGTVAVDHFGVTWRNQEEPYPSDSPLKNPDLNGYEWPEVSKIFAENWWEIANKTVEDNPDKFIVAQMLCGPFELGWALRGFQNMLMDSIAEPEFFQELINRVTDYQLKVLEEVFTLPVDGILLLDDWGGQQGVLIGPKRWRTFLKEPLRRIYDFIHSSDKIVMSHCCGNIVDILPDAIEIGLDVFQSVQSEAMDIYEIKKLFGQQITFWGGIGSQSIIPFGTPGELRAEIKKMCEEMGRGGGYILAPAKPLFSDTPVENAVAIVEAFMEQAGILIKK
jgi:uroporphyrinogen decarboxylase